MSGNQGLTPFGRWLVNRGVPVRRLMWALVLPVYVVTGAIAGAEEAKQEWEEDRKLFDKATGSEET